MCNFLSALVFKNGKIYCDPEHTDSHSDLIAAKGLTEESDKSIHHRGWIRIEFTPGDSRKYADVDAYVLIVDESSAPDWFDKAMRFDVTEQLKDIVRGMIVTDEREILLGGCWILAGEAKVKKIVRATVRVALDSSQVGTMWGSSQVGKMWGSSQVGKMFHSTALPDGKKPTTDNRHVKVM